MTSTAPCPQPPNPAQSPSNLPSSILFPSLSTYNLTSASQYSNKRYLKSGTIKRLSASHTISFWQETRLAACDTGRLTAFHSNDNSLFLSNHPSNTAIDPRTYSAGVAITISNLYLSQFHTPITHPLDPSLTGHALLILLTHRTSGHTIALLNVYRSSSSAQMRQRQLTNIFHNNMYPFPPHHFLAMAGDFNFNVEISDSSSMSEPRIPAAWPDILYAHKIHEIKQELPTFLSIARRSLKAHTPIITSRIDRIYLSLTEAHYSSLLPSTHVISHKLKDGFNSHLPVSLSLSPILPSPHPSRMSIPPWIISHKHFPTTFDSIYTKPPRNAGSRLTYFKSALYKTKSHILQLAKRSTDELHELQVCVKALRLIMHPPPPPTSLSDSLRHLIRSTPKLLSLIQQHPVDLSWNTVALTEHINSLFHLHGEMDPCNTPKPSYETPPLRPFDPSHKPPSIARDLKLLLPSSRSRTTRLRDTTHPSYIPADDSSTIHTAPLTDSPGTLFKLIDNFWGKLWMRPNWPNPKTRAKNIEKHLSKYHKRLNVNLIRPLSLEIILQAIAHSGDSAVGPDGIPFAAYRVLAHHAAPLLLDVAQLLCTPSSIPTNFNTALLLLLPKDNTELVDHQRPLGINNTDNRIIANAFLYCTLEAIQVLVDPAQKMFLPGRQLTDHVRMFNELFYTSLFDKTDFFLLFLDNIKAFDSLFHDYILAVLTKQGFPIWFLHAITNLLRNITLIPTLAPDFRLRFLKGIKQGCPLSPVLFILIYDVLITYLKDAAPVDTWVAGAADDLAIGAKRLEDLLVFLPIIDSFADVSGLQVHRLKTGILATSPSTVTSRPRSKRNFPREDIRYTLLPNSLTTPSASAAAHRLVLQSSPWPTIRLVDKHKYLGVTFANNHISYRDILETIYQAPLNKAKNRLASFRKSLSFMTLQKRIHTINFFVTPIFSYLISFFIPPVEIYKAYRKAVTAAIIPFAGSGYSYEHLVIPPSLMGPHTPLQDLWILTALRQLFPFITTITRSTTPWGYDSGVSRHDSGIYWFSPRITDNRNLLLMEVLGPYYINWDSRPNYDLSLLTKKSLKTLLITSAFHSWSDGKARKRSSVFFGGLNRQILLGERFAKYGDGLHDNTLVHFSFINRATTPPLLISHHIKCYTNTLETHHRLASADVSTFSTHYLSSPANPYPCYLCPHGTDHNEHIHKYCPSILEAITHLHSTGHIDTPFMNALKHNRATNPTYHFNFTTEPSAPDRRLRFTLCLNLGIWKARNRLKSIGGKCSIGAPAKLISHFALALYLSTLSKGPPKIRKSRNLAAFLSLMHSTSIRATDSLIFTDGGAKPNPGPSGAGILIIHSLHDKSNILSNPHTRLICPLGHGTNNLGELWALGAAGHFLHSQPITPHPTAFHAFSDSRWALKCIASGLCKTPALAGMAFAAHLLYRDLTVPLTFYNISGHSENPGGDTADTLASKAIEVSQRDPSITYVPPPLGSFLYHKLPP